MKFFLVRIVLNVSALCGAHYSGTFLSALIRTHPLLTLCFPCGQLSIGGQAEAASLVKTKPFQSWPPCAVSLHGPPTRPVKKKEKAETAPPLFSCSDELQTHDHLIMQTPRGLYYGKYILPVSRCIGMDRHFSAHWYHPSRKDKIFSIQTPACLIDW